MKSLGQKWSDLHLITKAYLLIGGFILMLYLSFAWALFLDPQEMRHLCLVSSDETYHHFQYSDGSYCRIDWLYLLKEPIFLSILVFVAFTIPAFTIEGIRKIIIKIRK